MRSLALAAAAIAAAPAAQAQAYPAKPVRLIVPYPAGGATDFFARTVFTKMSESLGQQVVVENRPGAGTAIGASEVARSTPDGYTLLLGDAGTYAFKQRADIIMTPSPYKGGADAMTDLIGGRISAMFPDIASALPQIRGGKLRALAVASDKRVAALPGLPTLGESGYPGFEAWAWQGFVAPAGTPRAVVMKLNAEFARVMADPAIRQRLAE